MKCLAFSAIAVSPLVFLFFVRTNYEKGSSPEQLSVKSATDVSCMLTNVEYFLNTFFFIPFVSILMSSVPSLEIQITGICHDISTQVENANWKLQDRTNINHAGVSLAGWLVQVLVSYSLALNQFCHDCYFKLI